jgi:hypothetical protein
VKASMGFQEFCARVSIYGVGCYRRFSRGLIGRSGFLCHAGSGTTLTPGAIDNSCIHLERVCVQRQVERFGAN